MYPDVKAKDFYFTFITNAKNDIIKYTKEIESLTNELNKQLDFIIRNKAYYRIVCKIDIDDYPTYFIDKKYDSDNVLLKKASDYSKTEINSKSRVCYYRLLVYCELLRKINEYNRMIVLANKRKDLNFKKYQKLIGIFYNQVHKEVLQGLGYRFNYGIGTFCICRWKITGTKKPKLRLDYDATRKNKEALIAQGKKIFNNNEAQWYALRGIPYDGIDYRVYTKDTHLYDINIIKSKLFTYRNHNFEHSEYVGIKVRGKSYKDMADECKTLDDIVNYPVDIRYKLNMWLYKDPTNYILYIRNDEQDMHKHGAHNS